MKKSLVILLFSLPMIALTSCGKCVANDKCSTYGQLVVQRMTDDIELGYSAKQFFCNDYSVRSGGWGVGCKVEWKFNPVLQ